MADSADGLLGIIRADGVMMYDRLEAFAELDDLLTSGGPLPTAWAAPVQELRRVQDVTDPRAAAVLLRFYDDDHGPCGSYTAAAGPATLPVPAGAEEVTVELVPPGAGQAAPARPGQGARR